MAAKHTYQHYIAQPGQPRGALEFWRIGDITFVPAIQRDPTPTDKTGTQSLKRITALGKLSNAGDPLHGFDPDKAGVLRGAILTDGQFKGCKVLTDGLGRKTLAEYTFGDDYLLPVWAREMAEVEAAVDFLEYNGSVKKPTPFDHFHVSEVVDAPEWAVIRKGLEDAGVEGAPTESGAYYGDGDKGRVVAIAALKRVAANALRDARNQLDEHLRDPAVTADIDLVDDAAKRITAVFGVSRSAFVGDVGAHDADLLQAIARLYSQNGDVTMELPDVKARLVEVLKAGTDVRTWRTMMIQAEKTYAGSVQRSVMLARLVGEVFNDKRQKATKDLVVSSLPSSVAPLRYPVLSK